MHEAFIPADVIYTIWCIFTEVRVWRIMIIHLDRLFFRTEF